jgi:hypothetical protein
MRDGGRQMVVIAADSIRAETHIVDLVRVSGEALGKVRPAAAFDQLPERAK